MYARLFATSSNFFTRPFEIAIFCVPDSSRAASAIPATAVAHQPHHRPEWQLHQANVFASLPQHSSALQSHKASPVGHLFEEKDFAADALADGVSAGACRVMVCLRSIRRKLVEFAFVTIVVF